MYMLQAVYESSSDASFTYILPVLLLAMDQHLAVLQFV